MNFGRRSTGPDEVEHSRHRACHAVTEMNFGRRSTGPDEVEHSRHRACHAVTEMMEIENL
jgi:hypothetical protein